MVCFLDLNGVAQAEGSQEQLLATLGGSEGELVTSLMSRIEPTSQHLVMVFVYAYFKTKKKKHPFPASAVFAQPGADYKALTVINTEISYLFCFAVIFEVSISLREAIHL